ncbi:MAG: hypothetical protein KC418_19980 [Anaerolineales bacterium]|nr:hypothetical protein [Anaerolineales bacterium]MCB8952698.1 hypothetical protein [Ardenticatenales bacterium]
MLPKPDDLFKQSFEQWEKQTADFWNAVLRDPGFLKSAWQVMEISLKSQQAFNQATQANLEAWQFPTRDRQERILHQINRLQMMLDDLDDRLDTILERLEMPANTGEEKQ